jgi:hypothetical protein
MVTHACAYRTIAEQAGGAFGGRSVVSIHLEQ